MADISLEVYYTGEQEAKMQEWLGTDLTYCQQSQGDLGKRIELAFEQAFARGMERVVIIGVDCPDITVKVILEAFLALKSFPVVLGPAVDGGYYLIGLNQLIRELFQAIPWGTGDVLAKTCQISAKLGLEVAFLPTLADVDRPEDYTIWAKHR